MEWFLLAGIPSAIVAIIALLTQVYPLFVIVVIYPIVIFIFRVGVFETQYNNYLDNERKGDHFWLEWNYYRRCWYATMNEYNPRDYCKMDLKSFITYYRINPSRYELRCSCVVFEDDDNHTIYIVFNRLDEWKYYLFKRKIEQSENLLTVIEFVQSDIDKMREDAAAYVEKAKQMYKSAFDQLEETGSK